ncbi:MAG: carboxypeptidase-like regulatory domain-containing protein [Acidobacteriota bacterium]
MTKRDQVWNVAVLIVALGSFSATLHADGGSISGTVRQFGARVIEPSVSLTSYANENCAALAEKKDRSKTETDQLMACRKEKMRTTKGDRTGTFELTDLPAGWYSLTISWPQGNFAAFCSESPSGWVIKNVQSGELISIVATSFAFELKATDKLEKDLAWCR